MSIVILACDDTQARDIFNDWLKEPAYFIAHIPEYEISPVPLKGQPRTWLSIKCKPAKVVRIRAITIMASCLLVCLSLVLLLPSFIMWAGRLTATSSPFMKLFV